MPEPIDKEFLEIFIPLELMRKLHPKLTKREILRKFLLIEGTHKTLSKSRKFPEPKSSLRTPTYFTITLIPFPT